jgi:hypothetical protein
MDYDPIEDSPEYRAIEKELEKKLEAIFRGERRGRGFCHKYWKKKQEILRVDFGIEWRSPAQLNPRRKYD